MDVRSGETMRLSKRYLHAAALAVILGMTLGFAAIPPAANATSEGSSPMDGVYQLVNVGSGKYLDVAGTVPGSNVQQYTGNGAVAQERHHAVVIAGIHGVVSVVQRPRARAGDVRRGEIW